MNSKKYITNVINLESTQRIQTIILGLISPDLMYKKQVNFFGCLNTKKKINFLSIHDLLFSQSNNARGWNFEYQM